MRRPAPHHEMIRLKRLMMPGCLRSRPDATSLDLERLLLSSRGVVKVLGRLQQVRRRAPVELREQLGSQLLDHDLVVLRGEALHEVVEIVLPDESAWVAAIPVDGLQQLEQIRPLERVRVAQAHHQLGHELVVVAQGTAQSDAGLGHLDQVLENHLHLARARLVEKADDGAHLLHNLSLQRSRIGREADRDRVQGAVVPVLVPKKLHVQLYDALPLQDLPRRVARVGKIAQDLRGELLQVRPRLDVAPEVRHQPRQRGLLLALLVDQAQVEEDRDRLILDLLPVLRRAVARARSQQVDQELDHAGILQNRERILRGRRRRALRHERVLLHELLTAAKAHADVLHRLQEQLQCLAGLRLRRTQGVHHAPEHVPLRQLIFQQHVRPGVVGHVLQDLDNLDQVLLLLRIREPLDGVEEIRDHSVLREEPTEIVLPQRLQREDSCDAVHGRADALSALPLPSQVSGAGQAQQVHQQLKASAADEHLEHRLPALPDHVVDADLPHEARRLDLQRRDRPWLPSRARRQEPLVGRQAHKADVLLDALVPLDNDVDDFHNRRQNVHALNREHLHDGNHAVLGDKVLPQRRVLREELRERQAHGPDLVVRRGRRQLPHQLHALPKTLALLVSLLQGVRVQLILVVKLREWVVFVVSIMLLRRDDRAPGRERHGIGLGFLLRRIPQLQFPVLPEVEVLVAKIVLLFLVVAEGLQLAQQARAEGAHASVAETFRRAPAISLPATVRTGGRRSQRRGGKLELRPEANGLVFLGRLRIAQLGVPVFLIRLGGRRLPRRPTGAPNLSLSREQGSFRLVDLDRCFPVVKVGNRALRLSARVAL
eukprot:scaffold7063_cov351-Pinguiococcus_pyrenoidosus.AAC.8